MPSDSNPAPETMADVCPHTDVPPRVLVVDDNAANRVVAERMLNLRGCEVVLAPNGAVAVDLVRQQRFDAILMDCQMPELDGYAATREIRAHENGSRIPIIAMTASVMPADREAATAAGMDDFLSKPVSLEEFSAAIQRWVRPRADHATAAGTGQAPNDGEGEVLDRGVISELREVYPQERLPSLIQTFRTQGRQHLDDAIAAHASNDRDALRRAAHALRGSSLTLGATRLAAAAADVEQAPEPAHLTHLLQRLQREWTAAVDALSADTGIAVAPMMPSSPKPQSLSPAPATRLPPAALPTVLLVEDDLAAAELTQTLLARTGLRNKIVHFTDGTDALTWLRNQLSCNDSPALALLDLHLPGCSGLDILRWLRDSDSDVPVIMLTAATDLDEINEAYALGIASYLVKPAGAGAIADIVRGLTLPWVLLPQAD